MEALGSEIRDEDLREIIDARAALEAAIARDFVMGTLADWQRRGVYLVKSIGGVLYEFRRGPLMENIVDMTVDGHAYTTENAETNSNARSFDTPFGTRFVSR